MNTGSLAGLLVVDLSRALAGPHAAMMLGDLGAEVIKVEPPGRGDDSRTWGPPFIDETERTSTYFLSANRNKQSIVLDLKAAEDKEVLLQMVARADVLVENFRPGVLDRLGLSLESLLELNPALVALSISGFGHDGPESSRPGYDQILQGEAGLMSLTGSGPEDVQRVGVPIADLLAGINGAFGVVSALHERSKTGKGTIVRTSLLASLVGVHAFQGTRYTVAGEVGAAQGNHHPSIAPYGLFRCGDGAVQIAVGSESLWRRFCEGFDLDPDRPDYATNGDRVGHRAALVSEIEGVFSEWSSAALLERLADLGIPAGKVRTLDEVYNWDQALSQGLLLSVDHPEWGKLDLPGSPLRFFDGAGNEHRADHRPPPALDEHADQVRAWLREPDAAVSEHARRD